jgi:hypothetical protein
MKPFAYVLLISSDSGGHLVQVYHDLNSAEQVLHDYSSSLFADLADDEVVQALAECGDRARIYAVTTACDGIQDSDEIVPFAQRQAA